MKNKKTNNATINANNNMVKMCTQIENEVNEKMTVMMDEICNKFLSNNRVNSWNKLVEKMKEGKFNNWCNKLHTTAYDYVTLRYNFPIETRSKIATGTVFRMKTQMDRHMKLIAADANNPFGGVEVIENID